MNLHFSEHLPEIHVLLESSPHSAEETQDLCLVL